MSRQVNLTASVSVVLDVNGNGTVQIGPQLAGVSWVPTTVAVLVVPTSTTVVSSFNLYLGNAQPANFIGGTYTGDNNSDDITATLYPGFVLTGVWSGGNPGAVATMTVNGTQNIPG